MSFNYGLLKERIKQTYDSQDKFAKALGISRTSLNRRLNSAEEFTSKEIFKCCELLSIPTTDISLYFFTV